MIPVYQDPCFTFRFVEDRIIPRFHLEGVPAGQRVSVFRIDSGTGERQGLLATAIVADGGWVDVAEAIIVRAGEAFIVVPEPRRLNHSRGKMVLYGIGLMGVLSIVGYLCGLAVGGGNQFILAVCGGLLGGYVVLLGYGPIALIIRPLGALTDWFHGIKGG
jgi:hypothetical protein